MIFLGIITGSGSTEECQSKLNKNDKLEACTDHRQLDAFFRMI